MNDKDKKNRILEDLKETQAFAVVKELDAIKTKGEAEDLINRLEETKQLTGRLAHDNSLLLMFKDGSVIMMLDNGKGKSHMIVPLDSCGILKVLYQYFPYAEVGTIHKTIL